jgi:hypothetical protein
MAQISQKKMSSKPAGQKFRQFVRQQRGWSHGSSGKNTCQASMKPWVQTPVRSIRQKKWLDSRGAQCEKELMPHQ